MIRNFYTVIFLLLVSISVSAQSDTAQDLRQPVQMYKTFEHTSYTEILFSFSQTEQNGNHIDDKLRFSPVFNLGHEFHLNITKFSGIYTGLGIRNIGYIDRPLYFAPGATTGEKLKMKHRIYALVIPVGLKLGNMSKHSYISAGAELNIFLNYKEKVWLNDSKTKRSEWFSDRVELFNPSFFGQLTCKGSFIKFVLYPANFIKQSNTTFAGDFSLPNYPSSSANIFMVSFGANFVEKKVMKAVEDKKQVLHARF